MANSNECKTMSENIACSENKMIAYTPDEALALIIDLKLSVHQYEQLRVQAKARRANIYPLYRDVLEAKKKCYPEAVKVSEGCAEVDIQSLLNHTTERLIDSIKEKNIQNDGDLTLLCKWGCDGSSGQSEYKQVFNTKGISDANLFLITLVPIQLRTTNGNIIWQNSAPSSTRLCRPIKFEYAKETAEKIKKEVENIEKQIMELKPKIVIINNVEIKVYFCCILIIKHIFKKSLFLITYR